MHVHILGVAGTFMSGLAKLALELGYKVTGSDKNFYPPISLQLEQLKIKIYKLDDMQQLEDKPDLIVVGNALTRGDAIVEHILSEKLNFCSGPEFLYRHVLHSRKVIAIAGTHGKTTTTSMLCWILEKAGKCPGFLVGGIPKNFSVSARLGQGEYFVLEGDEYDTAFFDKRSKFIHYFPNLVVLNNLEFDHADIFRDLLDIQRQFKHLLRIVPQDGHIIYAKEDKNLTAVLDSACSNLVSFGQLGDIELGQHNNQYTEFTFSFNQRIYQLTWNLTGRYNAYNALAAMLTANLLGIGFEDSVQALAEFASVRRRMELVYQGEKLKIYDDFAHHPTAIANAIAARRSAVLQGKLVAVVDIGSNTMALGGHNTKLVTATSKADYVIFYQSRPVLWDLTVLIERNNYFLAKGQGEVVSLLQHILGNEQDSIEVLVMSNRGVASLHEMLRDSLHHFSL